MAATLPKATGEVKPTPKPSPRTARVLDYHGRKSPRFARHLDELTDEQRERFDASTTPAMRKRRAWELARFLSYPGTGAFPPNHERHPGVCFRSVDQLWRDLRDYENHRGYDLGFGGLRWDSKWVVEQALADARALGFIERTSADDIGTENVRRYPSRRIKPRHDGRTRGRAVRLLLPVVTDTRDTVTRTRDAVTENHGSGHTHTRDTVTALRNESSGSSESLGKAMGIEARLSARPPDPLPPFFDTPEIRELVASW